MRSGLKRIVKKGIIEAKPNASNAAVPKIKRKIVSVFNLPPKAKR